jgi:two-component system phosphate regulon sensor histidine kinase PhoR
MGMPKERILVADDDPNILEFCLHLLETEGYQVTVASDGYKAIEVARQRSFDLLLTDIRMPGIEGLEAAQVIRGFQPELVCVVMTGFGTMEDAIEAIKLGFSLFVEKPFAAQDLLQAVNFALEKERLRRENARLSALIPLFELNKTLMSTVDVDELAPKVLHTACDELGASIGTLMLNDGNGHLCVRASVGFDTNVLSGEGRLIRLSAHLLDKRQQIIAQRAKGGEELVTELLGLLNVENLLFNPLLAMDEPIGALVLVKPEAEAQFAAGDSELLSVLCGQAAIALQNARLFDEIRRAYQELQKLDHMKSEFINIAAHELRTPLAILLGHADLLESEMEDSGTKERLQIIIRNALRLRELISALLDMRLLQTGELRVNMTTFDIDELIEDVLQDFRPLAAEKALDLAADALTDLAPVRADRKRVRSTISNLIENAIKFTPEGGRIGISVQDREEELWVSVWDTGVGIPDQELENVFRPFYQVEDSLTRKHDGIGLGLSIAKGMIELCGGRIWAESILGEGSRFTFSLKK